MTARTRTAGLLLGVVVLVAGTTYVYTAPYRRFPGIRLGGQLATPPGDFTARFKTGVGFIKPGGFPPFVIRVILVPFKDGFITATRPDGGYWAGRVRSHPTGYVRHGDTTFAMKVTEVKGTDKEPYLKAWGGPDLDRRLTGGVIVGTSEPLRDWEVFLWTPR